MSPPLDYSKWDNLQVDSSSEDSDNDDSRNQCIEAEEGGEVHLAATGKSKKWNSKPVVTQFTKPQTVHLGNAIGRSEPSAPSDTLQGLPSGRMHADESSTSEAKAASSEVGSTKLTPFEDSKPTLLSIQKSPRIPSAGAVLAGVAWEQSGTNIQIWISLPLEEDLRRKTDRRVTLVKEKPADAQYGDRRIPASITAADTLEEAEEDSFPVAWGVEIDWPVSGFDSDGVKEPWKVSNEEALLLSMSGTFLYPVHSAEDSWNWLVEDSCPLVESSGCRFLHLEFRKKNSRQLGSVVIWWNKLFLHHEAIDLSSRPNMKNSHSFARVWKEAHDKFIQDRQSSVDNRIVINPDGTFGGPIQDDPKE